MQYRFKTADHPEANGRQLQEGDVTWTFWFALDEGTLFVETGQACLEALAEWVDRARAAGVLAPVTPRKRKR